MSGKEVGARLLLEDETLRDGLQMESRIFSLEEKLELFRKLEDAGVRRIQVGSFVHPKVVPQMADTDELVRAIGTAGRAVVSALVLNRRGLERAMACGVRHLSMSVSVSDTHSLKNAGRPAAEALDSMVELIGRATEAELQVRAGFQCSFGCVYEGAIDEDRVLEGVVRTAEAGAGEVNLADTTGMANPDSVRLLVEKVMERAPEILVSLHLHDTRGLGLANMISGYRAGVRTFDVCAGGLGGCPFVTGAAGNVSTEDAVNMFESMGIETGIDLERMCGVVEILESRLGRELQGRMKRLMNTGRNPP